MPKVDLLLVDADGEIAGEQGLGRDASPVEAHATGPVLLDDRHPQAELGGADGRDVAAGAGAHDREIEAFTVAHVALP